MTANIIKKQKNSKRKMLRKACEDEKLIILSFYNVSVHLKLIFDSGELNAGTVCAKFGHTASDGKNHKILFYGDP